MEMINFRLINISYQLKSLNRFNYFSSESHRDQSLFSKCLQKERQTDKNQILRKTRVEIVKTYETNH